MILPPETLAPDNAHPTPLFSAAAAECRTNRWACINGRSVVRIYSDINLEYNAAKGASAIADFSPHARYFVNGPAAGDFLSRLTTAPGASLAVGESARGMVLNDEGRIIDLCEVAQIAKGEFILSAAVSLDRRIALARRGMDVSLDNGNRENAAIGVIGPNASELIKEIGVKTPGQLRASRNAAHGIELVIRPLQFGDVEGFELLVAEHDAVSLWSRLMRRGNTRAIGIDALDVLRIENGVPRAGTDFQPAHFENEKTWRMPIEIGLPHLAPHDGGWFCGRRGLRHLGVAPQRQLLTISINGEAALPGAAVFVDGRSAGRITSSAWSPALKGAIAFADLSRKSKGRNFEVASNTPDSGRLGARPLETPESLLAHAFRKRENPATENAD